MNNQPNTTFQTMLFNNRFLIIKTVEGKNPVVVCEAYLEQNAALICQLLTDHADNKTLENGEKENDERTRT